MKIRIECDGYQCTILDTLPYEVEYAIVQALTYINTSEAYLQKQKGFRNIVSMHSCFNNNSFMTGLLPRVQSVLPTGIQVEVVYKQPKVTPVLSELPDWLYPHQKEGIKKAIFSKRGIISSPTGSGKATLLAYFLTHFPKENILVTVPSCNLLKNMHGLLEKTLGEEVGLVGDTEFEIKRVTVGIINSLILRQEELQDFYKEVSVVVRDEAHGSASRSHQQLSSFLVNQVYSIGLTATPWRTDGSDLVLEGVFGPLILKVEEKDLTKSGVIMKPEYYFIEVEAPQVVYKGAKVNNGAVYYPTPNGKPDPSVVYQTALVENAKRNQYIIDVLEKFLNSKERSGPALILTKSVGHGKHLRELAKERGIELPFVSGRDSSKKRMEYIEAMRANTLPCLCATNILNEGEDIKPLELLILAAGTGNEKDLVQRVGRVLRVSPGKKRAIVVDFWDKEPYYLLSHSIKRERAVNARFPHSVRRLKSVEELRW